jgi:hypothetical protein
VTTAKPDSSVSQTRPSSFTSLNTEGDAKDYRTRDGSDTSLVSFGTHAQSEEEDPANEGAKDEGRGDREGVR